jgi:hypothetical protein
MFTPNIEKLLTPAAPPPTVKDIINMVADGVAVAPTAQPHPPAWSPTAAIAAMTVAPPKEISPQEI